MQKLSNDMNDEVLAPEQIRGKLRKERCYEKQCWYHKKMI